MGIIRAIRTQSNLNTLKYELIEIGYNIIINNWCNSNESNTRLYACDTINVWINIDYNILKQYIK